MKLFRPSAARPACKDASPYPDQVNRPVQVGIRIAIGRPSATQPAHLVPGESGPRLRCAWPDQTGVKLRRRLRSCFECGGPAPLSSGETWLAGEPAEALHFCRFRVYPVTCHSKRKCPQAGKWKRSSRRRAAGCPKRCHVDALESGPFDASAVEKRNWQIGTPSFRLIHLGDEAYDKVYDEVCAGVCPASSYSRLFFVSFVASFVE